MVLREVSIYRADVPYDRPYPLSFNKVDMPGAQAIVVEVRDEDGRSGWGEVTILPGYTHETVKSGWTFCCEKGRQLVGRTTAAAKRNLIGCLNESPHAVTPLMTAIEMLEDSPILHPKETARVPVLAPVRHKDEKEIPREIEELIAKGHRTLKIKMGFDVAKDLARLKVIRDSVGKRAKLRIDANQGYSTLDGCRFATQLDPDVVEWFEQPCDMKDWDANAAVAKVSAVPIMLDESIYNFSDMQRASGIDGVGFVKHVLEKFGGLVILKAALDYIKTCGMQPVVGNGGATDITSWQEACVARLTVDIACEMHSFLKVKEPLLSEPLPFENGDIVLRPDYFPTVNQATLKKYTVQKERFALPQVQVGHA